MGPPYELFYGLGTGGFETWMMCLAAEPDYVNALCEKLVDVWIENLKRFSQAVGNRVQILQFNDDFGTQDAPFISTKMFRELIIAALQARARLGARQHRDESLSAFRRSLAPADPVDHRNGRRHP